MFIYCTIKYYSYLCGVEKINKVLTIKHKDMKREKIAICRHVDITYGYIYRVNGKYGYYMAGSSIPEYSGSLHEVENYVTIEWNLTIKRFAKYRKL